MKVIISPSKTMNIDTNIMNPSKPKFIDKTIVLYNTTKGLNKEEIMSNFACSGTIADITKEYFNDFTPDGYSQAMKSYTGVQFQALDYNSIANKEYINNNVYILSAFYGLLKPLDMISLYRFDFINNSYPDNLYNFWGQDIYNELFKEKDIVLNLASSEYSSLINRYITKEDIYINFKFYTKKNNKLKEISVTVKKARGLMVRYISENNIYLLDDVKKFNYLDFKYNEELSKSDLFVFIKEE